MNCSSHMNIPPSSVSDRLKTLIQNGRGRVKINASHNIKRGAVQESVSKSIFALFITSSFTQWAQSVPYRWLEQRFARVNGCTGQVDSIKPSNGM